MSVILCLVLVNVAAGKNTEFCFFVYLQSTRNTPGRLDRNNQTAQSRDAHVTDHATFAALPHCALLTCLFLSLAQPALLLARVFPVSYMFPS